MLRLIALRCITLHRYCIFFKSKACGQPVFSVSVGTTFPTAFAYSGAPRYVLVILAVLHTFIITLFGVVTDYGSLKAQMTVSIL